MRFFLSLAVVLFGAAGFAGAASAQGVAAQSLGAVGLTVNQVSGGTSLNLVNTGGAISNGGLFAGAVSSLNQGATNSLNTYGGFAGNLAALPVLGGAGQVVTINMATSASAPTSLTVSNTNFAANAGISSIIGALGAINAPWIGGYGGAAGGVASAGVQGGTNSANAAAFALAPGSAVNLSQMSGGASPANFSVVNTLGALGTTGPASVGGGVAGAPGLSVQTAGSALNTATTMGAAAINLQQVSQGLAGSGLVFQSVDRALSATTPALGFTGLP